MVAMGGLAEMKTGKFWQAVIAELIGTSLLVAVGVGGCLDGSKSTLHVGLNFGIAVATVVWCIAHVSGGHINPAVTIGFLVTRKISIARGLLYMVAQCIGASLGALFLKINTPEGQQGRVGPAQPIAALKWYQVMSIETLITFVLVFTVFATCDGRRKGFGGSGPLTIGLSITMGHFWAVPLTGAATNPGALFGCAAVFGNWNYHWVYWLGTLNGGIHAALLYDLLFAVNAGRAKAKSFFTECDFDDANFDESGRRVAGGARPGDHENNAEAVKLDTR